MAAVLSLEPRYLEPAPEQGPRLRLVEPTRQLHPRPARRASRAVYRRRRLVAALVGLGLVLTLARAGAAFGGPSLAPSERLPHVHNVVVAPGDSLWSIARRAAPGADARAVVAAMIAARGGAPLQVGETVAVPAT